jgi:hypothetical protein
MLPVDAEAVPEGAELEPSGLVRGVHLVHLEVRLAVPEEVDPGRQEDGDAVRRGRGARRPAHPARDERLSWQDERPSARERLRVQAQQVADAGELDPRAELAEHLFRVRGLQTEVPLGRLRGVRPHDQLEAGVAPAPGLRPSEASEDPRRGADRLDRRASAVRGEPPRERQEL